MRLSYKRTKDLQALLKEMCDLELTEEQAQEAGLQIMRFVIAKTQCKEISNTKKEKIDERHSGKTT